MRRSKSSGVASQKICLKLAKPGATPPGMGLARRKDPWQGVYRLFLDHSNLVQNTISRPQVIVSTRLLRCSSFVCDPLRSTCSAHVW